MSFKEYLSKCFFSFIPTKSLKVKGNIKKSVCLPVKKVPNSLLNNLELEPVMKTL